MMTHDATAPRNEYAVVDQAVLARMAGAETGRMRLSLELNPYAHGTPLHEEWLAGWRRGQFALVSDGR